MNPRPSSRPSSRTNSSASSSHDCPCTRRSGFSSSTPHTSHPHCLQCPARPELAFASGALFTEIHTSLLPTPLTLQRVAVEASYCLSPSLLRCAVRCLQQWRSSLDATHFASSFFASFSLLHPFHLFQNLFRSLSDFPAEATSLSEDLTDLLFSYLLFLHSLPHLASSLFAHAIVLFSNALLTLPSPHLTSTHCSQLLSLLSPSVPLESLFSLLGLVLVSQPALLTCARNTGMTRSEDSLRLFFSALPNWAPSTRRRTRRSAQRRSWSWLAAATRRRNSSNSWSCPSSEPPSDSPIPTWCCSCCETPRSVPS